MSREHGWEFNRRIPLTQTEKSRYARHILLPEIGEAGQERIKAAKVLIVGLGGLGSPLALYLAAAGIGTLGLADFDEVEESNLQRQIIHTTGDLGRPKTASAGDAIHALNPLVEVAAHQIALNRDNSFRLLSEYDIVADCTDNFPARYLVNDTAVALGKPVVHGSVHRFDGQATVFDATRGPCYRCLYPHPPEPGFADSCAESGVLGVVPGLIGVIQATETLKLILGAENSLIGRLVTVDTWTAAFREVAVRKDPHCPVCGKE